MVRLAVLSLLGAAVLALSACGGGGGKKLSKADLGKKADSVCKGYSDKVSNLPQPSGSGDTKALSTYFQKAQKLADDQQSDLEKLKPADDVKADWKAFLSKDKAGTDLLGKLATAAEKKDTKTATTLLAQITKIDNDINAAATKVGAVGCGSGGVGG